MDTSTHSDAIPDRPKGAARRNTMSATGIGAAVRRKEDQRFITGKGQYTDDINRPGQAYAYLPALAPRPRQHQEHRHVGRAQCCPACSAC